MNQLLEKVFSNHFRKIWVQYSKFSTCITLFPVDKTKDYRFITAQRKIQNADELIELINNNLLG